MSIQDFAHDWRNFQSILIDKKGYIDVLLGLKNSLLIAVVGLLLGIIIGTLIATVRVMPKYKSLPRILDKFSSIYVAFFRGTPIVVQLLLGYYVIPKLLNFSVDSMTVAMVIMGMNSGAYVSEIMRSGIQSVDPGQMEGGRAVGLSYGTSMSKIVIPQAVKNILPTIGNEFIALVKETTVVSFIGAVDIYKAFRSIGSSDYSFTIPFLVMAILYIVIVMLITFALRLMERGLAKSDRNH